MKNEVLNAIERISKAFSEKHITVKEVYLSLPVLVAMVFEDQHITKDLKEQKRFYKDLKNTVDFLIGDENGV